MPAAISGMIAKLSNTNTGDTLRASGDVAYARVTYPHAVYVPRHRARDRQGREQDFAGDRQDAGGDLTLRYENNPETKQMLIYGMGDMHLSVLAAKAQDALRRVGPAGGAEDPPTARR